MTDHDPERGQDRPDEGTAGGDDEGPKGWAAKSSLSKVLMFILFGCCLIVLKFCVIIAAS